MKIDKLYLSHMHNDAYFSFFEEFCKLVCRFDSETLNIKLLYEALYRLFVEFDTAFKTISKSIYTAKLHEIDRMRDYYWHGIVETVKLALINYDLEVKDAAEKPKIILDTYGNIARKSYEEQTSAIVNVLQELRGKYLTESQKCGIVDWTDLLYTANEDFKDLMMLRFDEAAAKPHATIKDIRHRLNDAYNAITERINALIVIEGENNYRSL